MPDEPRTVCRTPTPHKAPTTIPSWKFALVRAALLEVIPDREPGIAFKELSGLVAGRLDPEQARRLGSIPWHVTTVKLELEVAGELRRVSGRSPQHVVRCAAT